MPEATPEFKRLLRDGFDALQVGQSFTFRRTFTAGDVATFCGVTGDYNPYHVDELFARESWYGRRITPGLLTGSMLTHVGGLLNFLATEMSFQFVAPVYFEDTVTCTVTIAEKDEISRQVVGVAAFVNQHGTEVLRARFAGKPGRNRLAR
ncbi:MAG: MaoC family dehydratase [Chloroflexi bacterium]|nr:MaoC family dehydratase [Chloroflexota bacterium]